MLKTAVSPQVAALLEEGEKSWFQQDLASPRTAKLAKEFLYEQGVRLAPWLPSGADASLLDSRTGSEQHEKSNKGNGVGVGSSERRPRLLCGLNRCCRSIKWRLKRVVAHGGRLSTGSLVEK